MPPDLTRERPRPPIAPVIAALDDVIRAAVAAERDRCATIAERVARESSAFHDEPSARAAAAAIYHAIRGH